MNAFASIEHRITGRRVSIGSAAGNDLILAHKSVAARHAIIRHTRRGCYIRDLGSESGTFLNGRRIEREEPLRAGDELRFGAARFAMVAGSQPTSRLMRYVGAGLGLMVLAAAGYLAVNFAGNWENLEQLASTSAAKPAASVSVNAPPAAPSISQTIPASPNAKATSAPMASVPTWLAAINEYRAGVKLPPVAEDSKLSDADRKHAMYVVKNYEDKVSVGHLLSAEMHDEEKSNPWYTPEGHNAAALSDVDQMWGFASPPSPTWALDGWMTGPFHRLWILNPRLHRVGYGEFCEKKYCVAALDLGSGASSSNGASPLPAPMEFPADKSITTLHSIAGEWPSPLSACAGFSAPAGLPATIALGAPVDAKLSEYQITRDGHGVESCGIDAETYQNPVSAEQERGRAILREQGAAMIIPRYPLRPGRYSVTATINDHAYEWSFAVAGAKAEPPAHEEAATSCGGYARIIEAGARKDDFEAALRAGYARAVKPGSESREEYERELAAKQSVPAATASSAPATAAKKYIVHQSPQYMRGSQSAFPDGPGAVAPAGPTQWLNELNRARSAVGLAAVAEDPSLSSGDLKHAKYIAMTYPKPTNPGGAFHTEDPSKPGYTPEGLAVAPGNVGATWWLPSPVAPPPVAQLYFLNGWLVTPFHRPSLLDPQVRRAGFGEVCEGMVCAGGLDTPESRLAVPPVKFAEPILFPPPKYPIALIELPHEWPDPLTPCPGYTFPVGLPITIQIGSYVDAKLSSYALTQASKPVEACGYDAWTYVNPNPGDQEHARRTLRGNGEVVIIPRKALTLDATYEVNATVNDHPYEWSFTVSK